jgi:hypothetical protein
VPPEVLHEYGLDMDYRSVKFSVLWTHLYQARTLACHTATETMDLRDVLSQLHHDLPWIQLLRSSNVPKTFPFDDLDVLHNFWSRNSPRSTPFAIQSATDRSHWTCPRLPIHTPDSLKVCSGNMNSTQTEMHSDNLESNLPTGPSWVHMKKIILFK